MSFPRNNFNNTVNKIYQLKEKYTRVKLTRYEMTDQFIQYISDNVHDVDKYNINILITVPYGRCLALRPTNNEELTQYLKKATSIPFITYPGFSLRRDLDGGFCILRRPRCKRRISFPASLRAILNIFNFKLSLEEAMRLYELGGQNK